MNNGIYNGGQIPQPQMQQQMYPNKKNNLPIIIAVVICVLAVCATIVFVTESNNKKENNASSSNQGNVGSSSNQTNTNPPSNLTSNGIDVTCSGEMKITDGKALVEATLTFEDENTKAIKYSGTTTLMTSSESSAKSYYDNYIDTKFCDGIIKNQGTCSVKQDGSNVILFIDYDENAMRNFRMIDTWDISSKEKLISSAKESGYTCK